MEACGRIERKVRTINGVERVGWISLRTSCGKPSKRVRPRLRVASGTFQSVGRSVRHSSPTAVSVGRTSGEKAVVLELSKSRGPRARNQGLMTCTARTFWQTSDMPNAGQLQGEFCLPPVVGVARRTFRLGIIHEEGGRASRSGFESRRKLKYMLP
jgi:hypothetical protein